MLLKIALLILMTLSAACSPVERQCFNMEMPSAPQSYKDFLHKNKEKIDKDGRKYLIDLAIFKAYLDGRLETE